MKKHLIQKRKYNLAKWDGISVPSIKQNSLSQTRLFLWNKKLFKNSIVLSDKSSYNSKGIIFTKKVRWNIFMGSPSIGESDNLPTTSEEVIQLNIRGGLHHKNVIQIL